MTDSERWIVVVEEPFLPADAGGRVETFGFLTAAAGAGIRLQVLVPTKGELDVDALERAIPGAAVIRLPRDETPLAHLQVAPYMYASRPVGPLRRALRTTPRRADAVISYSYRASRLGQEIARAWRLPHLVRAHNIESRFFEALARSSTGPRSLAYELEYRKLQLAERSLLHSPLVTAIADISIEDHEWRRERASVATFHLPPFLPLDVLSPAGRTAHQASPTRHSTAARHPSAVGVGRRVPGTLVFVGSLDTPPNVEALRWFVGNCWPAVRARVPAAALRVVGRRPERGLADWLRGVGGVELHTDVPSVDPYVTTAAVSVNPMRSGSGVNIKAVAAMAAGTPVVSTRTGSRGLNWQAGTHLLVADEPADFTGAVCDLLADPARAEALGQAGRAYVLRTLDHTALLGRVRAAL